MSSDEQVVESILKGNEENFSILIDKYYPKLMKFYIKLFVSRDDAQDIIQEVFIKVYKNLYKFNSKWAFNTWIYKIAVNTLKDVKKRKVINTAELDLERIAQNSSLQDSCIEDIHNKEIARIMLDSMDEKLRTIMILRYYEELSLSEIGLIFNMSADAVKMKVFRARERLCKDYSLAYYGGGVNEMHV